MTWELPRYPTSDLDAICRYWQRMAAIPLDEPGAEMIRKMARSRLRELEATCPAAWPAQRRPA